MLDVFSLGGVAHYVNVRHKPDKTIGDVLIRFYAQRVHHIIRF
jgi:hypothetical protein